MMINPSNTQCLPPIPEPEDLASAPMENNPVDLLFNPPGLGNEWGQAQTTRSIAGITAITFPPLLACGQPVDPDAKDYLSTCDLILDDRLVSASLKPGERITFQWFPHMVRRSVSVQGLEIVTECFMPCGYRSVLQRIQITNRGGGVRKGTVGVVIRAGVAAPGREKNANLWHWRPPSEDDNASDVLAAQGVFVFSSRHSQAVSVQGVRPAPVAVRDQCESVHRYRLAPGESTVFSYAHTLGDERGASLAEYEKLQASFDAVLTAHRNEVARRIRDAFTPGNSTYSGHLPQLHTTDPDLWRLYYTGFCTLFVARATPPTSRIGRVVYRAIGCRILPTRSCVWDLWPVRHTMALLDPVAMRETLEHLLRGDPGRCVIDYFTGATDGPFYPANHHSLVRCAHAYVTTSGDRAWLETTLDGRSVLDLLIAQATLWKSRDRHGLGLADYSDSPLLEVVPSYRGTVAGMNIGNLQAMLDAAQLAELCERPEPAATLRAEAKALAERILTELFVPGGWFRTIHADGSRIEVRHVYDLLMALEYLDPFLQPQQRRAMLDFFWRELATPCWLHALSPADPASTANVRADHQWCGSFPAWPAFMAKALLRHDPGERTNAWIRGLAATARQGVFGQAHLVDTVFPTIAGGARKCPPDNPYCNEWYNITGGAFTETVIDSILGVEFDRSGELAARPRLHGIDSEARLTNVRVRGGEHTVSGQGVTRDENGTK